ncbi:DUF1254 domain-containing protein [Nocardia sp. NPDC005978]|uniref:DUF1254 domain-containing protein n=1 Tax=Nocardia sp. NPDC005978 TaxID=3156725 RepID=UPI0033B91A3C
MNRFGALAGRPLVRAAAVGLSLAMAGLTLAACGGDSSDSDAGTSSSAAADDQAAIAADAYVFGYPLVLMDATRAAAGESNRFNHADALPTPADRQVVRLNLDTLYSQAWFDLKAEPMILQIPEMDSDRYWLMQILDAWTNTAHDPGNLDPQVGSGAKTGPFTYAVTGPGFEGTLPDGVTQLKMPTDMAWLLGRVQVNGESDVAAVQAIQDQMKLVPLSRWVAGDQENLPAGQPADKTKNPSQQVSQMFAPQFFATLNDLMTANPPAAADADAMKRFAEIGVAPGGNTDKTTPDVLNQGAQAGTKAIAAYTDPGRKNENGWIFGTDIGTYGTNYALRANTAMLGLGANLPKDAVYPTLFVEPAGGGANGKYTLHFEAGKLPPAKAFWSITAYDADSFLVANPANIYAVGHQVPVTANPDGSVDITVQAADPGSRVPAGNWLPIPESGKFSLTMRLYAPENSVIDGSWQPPALKAAS